VFTVGDVLVAVSQAVATAPTAPSNLRIIK
jgi:hypothetical protein